MEQLARAKDQLELRVQERTGTLRETVGQLEAFSYTLSHDLRASLRAIQSFSQIALAQGEGNMEPPLPDLLQKIVSASNRMDRLIRDVLALSRAGRQDISVEPVDVETLVRQIVAEQPELQSVRAGISIQGPLLPMLGHELSLSQCLTNLLSNAVKFVSPGVQPRVRIYSEPQENRVRLWVEDNGIGIPREAQQRIFEMFQRLHRTDEYEGTGLGLAIVRKAVERMGGQVGVESAPGQGSRFWIDLPKA